MGYGLLGRVLAALAIAVVLLTIGFAKGRESRQDEIDTLTTKRDAETLRANGNAAVVDSLKTKLVDERMRRQRMQSAAEQALADLTQQVVQLTRNAERTRNDLRKKASQDDSCTPLRALPVCRAVADGLWADAAIAGPH